MKYSAVFIGLLAISSVLSSCQDNSQLAYQGQKSTAVDISYVKVVGSEYQMNTKLQGRVTASLSAQVRPQVSGIVEQRLFIEGAAVEKGQLLYRIEPRVYQAAYNQAQADLTSAEATVNSAKLKNERYSNLLKIEGVSQQDADDAKAAYLQAKANIAKYQAALESAKINLDYSQIKAPISGHIGISNVTPGTLVTADQTTALATIRALDPIYVDVVQSSSELLKLRQLLQNSQLQTAGAQVSLELEDGSAYPLQGSLKMREVAVDEATGSVTLRAEFANPDGLLLPGMFVRAQVNQAKDSHAILVPQQAIYHDARGGAYAYTIDQNNKVESRTVVAQRAENSQWLITSGLSENDKLLVEGSSKVKPGSEVNPIEVILADDGTATDVAKQSAMPSASVGGQ